MENYFSQLLSRHAPNPAGFLQPVIGAATEAGADDIEWQPFPQSMEDNVPVTQQETRANAVLPSQTDSVIQPGIDQKTEYHQYLRQYFTRTVEGKGDRQTESLIGKAGEEPIASQPFHQPVSVMVPQEKQQREKKQAPVRDANLLISPSVLLPVDLPATLMAPALLPAPWLVPSIPEPATFPRQTPDTPKPAPSLTIGKILIELIPAKPIPQRTAHRPSPFQTTNNASRSSGTGFGLGQL